MKKLFKVCSLVAILSMVMAFNAMATPINGAISFVGVYNTDTGLADLSTATAFTSFSAFVLGAPLGDYAAVTSLTPITYSPFTFAPMGPVTPLWSFTSGGVNYSFDATGTLLSFDQSSSKIDIKGLGIAYIDGYDPTPGIWNLTANALGSSASFSASNDSTPVPEPFTLLLLGTGLLGLAGIRRKIKK